MQGQIFKNIGVALSRIKIENRGSVGINFALVLLPILTMIGAGVDYNRALSAKATLQTAVDAATIIVVQASSSTQAQRQTLAQNTVAANLGQLAKSFNVTVTESDPSTAKSYYEVVAYGSLPTTIMSVAGFDSMAILAKSGANYANNGPGNGCVLSLDTSAVDDIWDNGNATVALTNCDIYDDSSNGAALAVGGSSSLSARKISVVGGVSGTSKITATAGIVTGAARTPDPYAWLNIPSYIGCDQTNYSTTKNATLSPGVYCGGISITSKAVVTMNPGLYIINGGSFTINGQASLSSATVSGVSGVTLVFTSSTGNNLADGHDQWRRDRQSDGADDSRYREG